jgi:hypothetical protein
VFSLGRGQFDPRPIEPLEAEQRKFQILQQKISTTACGGLSYGKFAIEHSDLALCRLAVINGPAQPAI